MVGGTGPVDAPVDGPVPQHCLPVAHPRRHRSIHRPCGWSMHVHQALRGLFTPASPAVVQRSRQQARCPLLFVLSSLLKSSSPTPMQCSRIAHSRHARSLPWMMDDWVRTVAGVGVASVGNSTRRRRRRRRRWRRLTLARSLTYS